MIWDGQYWAASWKMPGLFHNEAADPHNVSIVADILTMWDCIERGYEKLSNADKARVRESTPSQKTAPEFEGFDGNDEIEFVGIARFLVEQLGRFSRFKDRDFDAHMSTLVDNRDMLAKFKPMLERLRGGALGAEQIITLLRVDRK